VGCGRSFRRDDQVGLRVARLLARDPPPRTVVESSEGAGTDAIAGDSRADLLIVVDAAAAGDDIEPGRVERIVLCPSDSLEGPHLRPWSSHRGEDSTHVIGVRAALELSATLGLLPDEVWVYAVAGRDFGYGRRLSPAVERAVRGVALRVRGDIVAWRARRSLQHA
jgi:hydrogenase maturation protease